MTKAERVGSQSVRSYYTDGRFAVDLLKINASDLRQSCVFSYRHTDDRTSFSCKREPLLRQYERIPLRIKYLKINDGHVSSQLFILC